MPEYFDRLLSGVRAIMILCLTYSADACFYRSVCLTHANAPDVTPAVASPVTALPTMRAGEVGARAARRLPEANRSRLTSTSRFAGIRLYSFPKRGWQDPDINRLECQCGNYKFGSTGDLLRERTR